VAISSWDPYQWIDSLSNSMAQVELVTEAEHGALFLKCQEGMIF
jgi:hypothetical protein